MYECERGYVVMLNKHSDEAKKIDVTKGRDHGREVQSGYYARKRKSNIKNELGQTFFEVIVLVVFIIIFVFPFINLIAVSLSSSRAILSGEVYFLPVEPQLDTWQTVFKNKELIDSFVFTVFLTALYTVLALVFIMLAAYPLSKKTLKGRVQVLGFFMIPMYFSGGLIPSYLLYRDLNLIDSFWVLVLPGLFSTYNMLILKSFFQQIPDSLEESAKLDGANDFQILFSIYIPLSLPALATLALFFAVSRWNSFSDAIFFLPTRNDLVPLQLLLQRMLNVTVDTELMMRKLDGTTRRVRILKESQKAANILFTIVPIILVYPWLQRYFVKGVTLGSIKG